MKPDMQLVEKLADIFTDGPGYLESIMQGDKKLQLAKITDPQELIDTLVDDEWDMIVDVGPDENTLSRLLRARELLEGYDLTGHYASLMESEETIREELRKYE